MFRRRLVHRRLCCVAMISYQFESRLVASLTKWTTEHETGQWTALPNPPPNTKPRFACLPAFFSKAFSKCCFQVLLRRRSHFLGLPWSTWRRRVIGLGRFGPWMAARCLARRPGSAPGPPGAPARTDPALPPSPRRRGPCPPPCSGSARGPVFGRFVPWT